MTFGVLTSLNFYKAKTLLFSFKRILSNNNTHQTGMLDKISIHTNNLELFVLQFFLQLASKLLNNSSTHD